MAEWLPLCVVFGAFCVVAVVAVAACTRLQRDALVRWMAQAEEGLQKERLQTRRFADALVAICEPQGLAHALRARAQGNRDEATTPAVRSLDGQQAQENLALKRTLLMNELSKARRKLEEYEAPRPVETGPGAVGAHEPEE